MADLANPALATTLTAIRSVSVAGQRGRASACGDGGGAAGAGDAAKVTSLYSLKYETKNLNDILSAAVFVAAARDIRERQSTSEDTGSSRRNALHCAQRSLNLGPKELCSSVAAAIAVGADPSAASDDVTYVQARDFVRVAEAAEKAGASGLPFGFGTAGNDSDSDSDDDSCRAARDFAAGLEGGACYSRVYRARGGKVPVSQRRRHPPPTNASTARPRTHYSHT